MFMETEVLIKLAIYYLIWILRWILEDFRHHMNIRKIADEGICKAIIWIRKFHFIFLNLVILDTFFFGTHALLHYNTKESNLQFLLTLFNLGFQTIDLVEVIKVCFSIDKSSLTAVLLKKLNPEKIVEGQKLISKLDTSDQLDQSVSSNLNTTGVTPLAEDATESNLVKRKTK